MESSWQVPSSVESDAHDGTGCSGVASYGIGAT